MKGGGDIFMVVTLLIVAEVLASESSINNITVQPLNPEMGNVVPAIPVQSEIEACPLDLTEELFSGIKSACGGGKEVSRYKCCPVLAAWLYAAHARTALRTLRSPVSEDSPVLPDDSHKCVDNLQTSLRSRGIRLPHPNETCDPVLCFCGIRLHQISSLTCPQAFNVTARRHANATSSHLTIAPSVRALEENCRTPTSSGCSTCLRSLQQLDGMAEATEASDRTSRINSRGCELMGLTWLLVKNKTAYIPTVSAVFRALMYSGLPPHTTVCSANREKMPLPVDSSQLGEPNASAASFTSPVSSALIVVVAVTAIVNLFWK